MNRRKSAFTLVELMIVIAIIGILAAIAVPNFNRARDKAKTTKCYEFSSLLTRTAELYSLEQGEIPDGAKVDILSPYLANKRVPLCPSKGTYRFIQDTGPLVGKKVECSIHGCATATFGG